MLATSPSSMLCSDIGSLLRTKYAIFTGSHDKEFRSLVIFPDLGIDALPDESFSLLMKYFSGLQSTHSAHRNCAVLIDRRSSDWSSVHSLLNKLKTFSPTNLERIYILKPQGFLQRLFVTSTMTALRERCCVPIEFFDQVSDLSCCIDPEHLPTDMAGQLLFSLEDWIKDQMSIEAFQTKVEQLCSHGSGLIAELRGLHPTDGDAGQLSQNILHLNPFFVPPFTNELQEKRRHFLNAVNAVESEGLKLRQALRDTSEDSQLCDTETETWPPNGLVFDLPVDRVFHVINLEHILVRLTEARAKFVAQWAQFSTCVQLVHLIDDLNSRFDELQSLGSIWENLLESSLDYGLIRSGHSFRSSGSIDSGAHSPADDSPMVDHCESSTASTDEYGRLEGIEAVLGRLREAEQLGNQLRPELQSLFHTSEQLVGHVFKPDSSGQYFLRPQDGLSIFNTLGNQSVEDNESNLPSTVNLSESASIRLPSDVLNWPILFGRLSDLANGELTKALDQLSRIHELQTEIINANEWLSRGSILIESLPPLNEVKSLSLADTHKHLDEVTAFAASREQLIKVLTDPKQFRSRFAEVVTPQIRGMLRDLLKNIEDLQGSCDSAVAALRQHISRSTFPRHTSPTMSSSNGSQSEPKQEPPETISSAMDVPASDVPPENTSVVPPASREASVKKLDLAWEEFIDTERSYISFLQHVHDVVWLQATTPLVTTSTPASGELSPSNPVPPLIRENPSLLLGNWPELLIFHRDRLLPTLECCDKEASNLKRWSSQVVPQLIDIYSVYCSVHTSAMQVAVQLERDRAYATWMSTCAEEVTRRESSSSDAHSRPVLQLSSRLVTPVQRFQRYHLLVGQLLHLAPTETDRSNFAEAHKAMIEMCETVNLTMRLRCLATRPSELGPLLLRGDFTISRDDSRSAQQRHVFLFTNAILVTKFRASGSSLPLPRSGSFSPIHTSSDERNGSNSSISSLPPLASNWANLMKSHAFLGAVSGPNGPATCDSGPVYEIREELLLAHIGLTPCVKSDRRRFAVWTANRAQTYVFQSADASTRDQWVRSINDLLMDQLRRLREEALQRLTFQRSRIPLPSHDSLDQIDRSSSLPVSTGVEMHRSSMRDNGSVLSLPGVSSSNPVQPS